ncbi:hypothetical protein DKT69_19810 [Micromonospora sicca]|uniref:Uncharacterized protein n=1 Tax=Micromonospora sicca TaxID=2202420 RepID=A0A317DHK0_9ACTN|nr:hypothetical protein DKT69_19810 [Micromonospora sp. 4G51]
MLTSANVVAASIYQRRFIRKGPTGGGRSATRVSAGRYAMTLQMTGAARPPVRATDGGLR